jgi:hypothetical protein
MMRILVTMILILAGIANVIPCKGIAQSESVTASASCCESLNQENLSQFTVCNQDQARSIQPEGHATPHRQEIPTSCPSCVHGCCQLMALFPSFRFLNQFDSTIYTDFAPKNHSSVELDTPKEPPRFA